MMVAADRFIQDSGKQLYERGECAGTGFTVKTFNYEGR